MATLTPFVQPGMTVFEPGPGMGFFTLEMARLAGRHGRIIAVDIQPKMLSALGRRAGRKGLSDRIEFRLADGTGMGIRGLSGKVDFVLAGRVSLPCGSRSSARLRVCKARRSLCSGGARGQLTNDAKMRLLSSSYSSRRLDRSGDSGLGATERNTR